MSDAGRGKSALRRALEEGPQEPVLLERATLFEQLQDAHAKNDKKKMLEIGQKLAANTKDIQNIRRKLRNAMVTAVEEARRVVDPQTRVRKLLDAFELCAKTQIIANDHFGDLETQNIAVQQYGAVVEELDTIPPGRIVLATFLDHSDDGVRVIAAAQLYFRDLMIEKVVPIVKHADERSVGAVGWTAFQAFHMHPVPAKT